MDKYQIAALILVIGGLIILLIELPSAPLFITGLVLIVLGLLLNDYAITGKIHFKPLTGATKVWEGE